MNLLKSLSTVSILTLISRILGFIRDVLIAQYFGAGMFTDAFFMAFKLPNLLRRIFAEGAFSQAFIPVFIEQISQSKKENKNNESVRQFVSCVSGLLITSITCIIVFCMILAPKLTFIAAPGFTRDSYLFNIATKLLRIMLPYILLISLASLVGIILNTYNYFLVPACTPILFNISIIISILFFHGYFYPPIIVLGWGVFFGGIIQLFFQLYYVRKINLLVIPKFVFNHPSVLLVMRRMGPAIIGMSVSQIASIINNIFSSFLAFGSLSWLYYSNRLVEFPIGVLSVALGTIILPSLSKSLTNNDYDEYSRLINWGLKICLLLSIPSTAGLIILSKPIIITLFQYGKFNISDAIMTQYALIAYSIGLVGLMSAKILVLAFYSSNDIKTPVRIAIITLIVTQLTNLLFFHSLKHVCLSLSISISGILNAYLLFHELIKKQIFRLEHGLMKFLFQIIISTLVMAIVLLMILKYVNKWEDALILDRILRLSIICTIGIAVYLFMLKVFGFKVKNFSYQYK
ncbi:murein biosynthesis integral membrane protein MurJ [Candidatus Pantoea edessiphila]|uniref:Probable lipid II flippase MurJ n=1 Tax=Candidatus Pantoea edessiphila TaxID=2044610 RepID=A0A2P5SYV7_9GAMM|nr:murein biosynthesis integral membrane protein MurJ [Candidatus Pantoea edessiphila]MBK4775345.1 murein biosynthesis integral membrane protein MurJ [Pantoea sp. Edef]PPI87521.1 murein biosynthesis integral membrane protein MurJ [Candidatus Pantoea edessiphila]